MAENITLHGIEIKWVWKWYGVKKSVAIWENM